MLSIDEKKEGFTMKQLFKCMSIMVMIIMIVTACSKDKPEKNGSDDQKTITEKNKEMSGDTQDFNPEGLPIFNEPVTYRIMTPHPELAKKYFEEKEVYNQVSEETNVIIEWQELPSSGWEEKINLAVNSGDLPDALYVGTMDNMLFTQAIEAGLVEPLDDYLQYAPNLMKAYDIYPNAKTSTTYLGDGKIYAYPGIGVKDYAALRAPLFINKQWLDNLGLEVPTTTEAYYEVLKAFKEQDANDNGDKNDEIPVTFMKYWMGYDFKELFGSWGIQGVRNKGETTIRQGKLYFHPIEDAYRQALTYFHTLYAQGLMDQESLTQDGAAVNAKLGRDVPIIGSFEGWSTPANHGDQYIMLEPLEGPNGDKYAIYNSAELDISNGMIIFSNCDRPEGLVRWVDYLNEGTRPIEMALGFEGTAWTLNEDDKTWAYNLPKLEELGITLEEYKQTEGTQNGPLFLFPEITGYTEIHELGSVKALKRQWSEAARPYFFKENWPHRMPLDVITEEDEDMSYIWADLQQYLDIFLADAIINGIDDAKWEQHLKECENLKYQQVVDYYQKKYDGLEK